MTGRRAAGAGALALAPALAGGAIAYGVVVQKGNLRITVQSLISPYKLPRMGTAPIAVFVSGRLSTPSGAIPPQLERLTVKVNRAGLLQSSGLPSWEVPQIQPASTERALSNCTKALIGSGRF